MTAEQQLKQELESWRGELATVLWEDYGVAEWKQEPEDLLRYLNWKVWCLRYRVSLRWLVRQVVSYFKNQRRRYKDREYFLGLSSLAMTGPQTEQYLRERLLEEYPNGENLRLARNRMRDRILGTGARKRDVPEGERLRRAWRGNPWR